MIRKFAALLCLAFALPAQADNLLQIYHDAQQSDPALASARAIWQATQERLPQARSALLPNIGTSLGHVLQSISTVVANAADVHYGLD